MNELGYSLRNELPKGGVQFAMKARTSAAVFAKQKEHITKTRLKVAADKDQRAKAQVAAHSPANIQSLLTTANKNHDENVKWQQARMDQLKKVDPKMLTAAERTVYDHVNDTLTKRSVALAPGKFETHANVAAKLAQEAKLISDMIKATKFTNVDFSTFMNVYAKPMQFDRVKTWNWDLGSPSVAEAHANGSLEVHAYVSMAGQSLHARGSFQVGGSALSTPFTLLDAVGDVKSSRSYGSQWNSHLHLHAKFFGHDIFPVIDKTAVSQLKSIDQHYPYDVKITAGVVTIATLKVNYTVGLRGDLHVVAGAVLSPGSVSTTPRARVLSTLYATGQIGGKWVRAGVRGSLNLVDEHIQLYGKAALLSDSQGRRLDLDFSVYNQLSLLGGNVELYAERRAAKGGYKEIGHLTLFSWGGLTPATGYVYGPEHFTIPLN